MSSTPTHIVSGSAMLPKGTGVSEDRKYISVVWEVDWEKGIILNAEFNTLTSLLGGWLAKLLKGYDLGQGIDPLFNQIEERCHIVSQRAFIKALEAAYQRYMDLRN